jgi:hypothetical protein
MRGNRRRGIAIVVAAAAAVIALPTSAQAGHPRSTSVSFRTETSNGYGFEFHGQNKANGEFASVELSKGRTYADYELRGRVQISAQRVRVGLGPLGRISLRFQERGRTAWGGEPCQFTRTERRGDFVGTVRFKGENGFTELDLDRVEGEVYTQSRRSCKGRNPHRRLPDPVVVRRRAGPPYLTACGPEPGTFLYAQRTRRFSLIVAGSYERKPYAEIQRVSYALSDASRFFISHGLKAATLTPPGPFFTGSASYSDGMTAGDLRVRMPGLRRMLMVPGEALLSRDYEDDQPSCPGFPERVASAASPIAGKLPKRAINPALSYPAVGFSRLEISK